MESIKNAIYNLLASKERRKWIETSQGKTMKMLRSKDTEKKMSLWPIKTQNQMKQQNLANFKLKLLTGLPTRHAMANRKQELVQKATELNKNKKRIRKMELKYEYNTCILCEEQEIETLENTDHIFNCPNNKEPKTEAASNILEVYNKAGNTTKKTILWFDNQLPKCKENSKSAKKLKRYSKTKGNRSMILKAWKKYLYETLKTSKKQIENVYRYSVRAVNRMTHKTWKIRCEALEEWVTEDS